jgi:predicted metal-dependent hydrolase
VENRIHAIKEPLLLILNLTKGLKYKSLSLLIADFMFKKILIAEDLDSISITVEQALKELSITDSSFQIL